MKKSRLGAVVRDQWQFRAKKKSVDNSGNGNKKTASFYQVCGCSEVVIISNSFFKPDHGSGDHTPYLQVHIFCDRYWLISGVIRMQNGHPACLLRSRDDL